MRTITVNRPVEGTLFSPEEMGMKSLSNGTGAKSFNLHDYLHSREGLWRLLACMPAGMSMVEALELAPSVIFGIIQEGGEV